MLSTIVFRYLGTVLQFVLLSVLARSVSQADYGLYMLCLSITFSGYYIVGLGASEAAVVQLSKSVTFGKDAVVGRTVGSVLMLCGIFATILLVCAGLIVVFLPVSKNETIAVAFVMAFIVANGTIFNIAQLLLSLGRSALGSFLFYPAINLTLLFSTVPLALLSTHVSFGELTAASAVGASTAAVAAVGICLRLTKDKALGWSFATMRALIAGGVGLTALRILHVVSFWIPTMVAGFAMSTVDAGVIGTAGRLAIAVSAVIAAIRFIIRPTIGRALAQGELDRLRKLAGSLAFITLTLALTALLAELLFGRWLIGLFFGENFGRVAPILAILLLSVCAEAIFGPVDEILKMSGEQRPVAWTYGIGVSLFLAGSMIASRYSLVWIAWLQVVYVFGIFLTMNLIVQRKIGFLILPVPPDLRLLREVR